MRHEAGRALMVIRACVAAGRYVALRHFLRRMDQRGLFWPDVLAVIDSPTGVRFDGRDDFDRPKWIISGTAADGVSIELVCVLDTDEAGDVTVFITVY
jgi:pentatricopeptide repeat protein